MWPWWSTNGGVGRSGGRMKDAGCGDQQIEAAGAQINNAAALCDWSRMLRARAFAACTCSERIRNHPAHILDVCRLDVAGAAAWREPLPAVFWRAA